MRMRQPGAIPRDVRSQGTALRVPQPMAGTGLAPLFGGAGGPAAAAPPGGLPLQAGGDPQIGHIFRNMRAAMRMSREAIARRLATTPVIIHDLENGAVTALPHWPETVRVVRAYCELLRLDPEPLLWRLQQLARQGSDEARAVAPHPGNDPPPLMLRNAQARDPGLREREPLRSRSRMALPRIVLLGAVPVALAGLAYLLVAAPWLGYRVISVLPDSLAEPARAGMDSVVLQSAPYHDGLRWIDVGNPRLRKGDKLPTKPR